MIVRVLYPRLSLRRVLAIVVLTGVVLSFAAPLQRTINSQGRLPLPRNERKGTPRPGKPEGSLKSLNQIRNEVQVEREPEAPVPSTIRSPKMPLRAWDGRRVGEPDKPEKTKEVVPERSARWKQRSEQLVRRAHSKRNSSAPPFSVLDDTFIDNFYTKALPSYTPLSDEKPYWRGQLRAAYAKNQTALNLAAIEMGKTIFESAAYLTRATSDSDYVSDLYWTYLMRAPDSTGWSFWTGVVGSSGRENVRRAFEESGDFLTLMTTIVPHTTTASGPVSLISAQTNPINQPGGGLLTRDGTWSLPLISLAGRSGLDLGLSLSYSSQVWTRSGPFIYFDEDSGTPSPGFRLGFPTIQRPVYNSQTNTLSYLLITSSGRRVELRQVGTSNVYEAADSSYLQLTDNGTTLLVRSTDGTQLTYQHANNAWRCNEIKDRNGNYLTIAIGSMGQITSVTDTLGRVLTFNYDSNVNLLSITQTWGVSTTHTWATFSWTTKTMQSSFSSIAVIGPKNGTSLPVLNRVTANDGTFFDFDYNNSLQVIGIRKYHSADASTLRSTNTFTYETPASDVPRLTDSRISALNWTGINGVPSEVTTTYGVSGSTYQLTAPDGTIYKETYGSGYQRGLVTGSEIWSGGVKQKWTTMTWTQDNTGLAYELNPRVTETNVYDAGGNRRRKSIAYHTEFGLPYVITEYQADAGTGLRFTVFDYKFDSVYINRRIIGLPDWTHIFDGSWNLMSKTQYNYDWDSSGDMFLDTPAAATQHDRTNYGPSFITGRGNLSQMARWDVTDPTNGSKTIERKWRVNSTGSVLIERDHLWHQKQYAYGDDFSDSVNRNTFAYPTTVTDEDGNQSTVKYNFDFGAPTRTQGPPPQATASPAPSPNTTGAIQEMLYNTDGSLQRVTTTNTGAYKRFWYGPDYVGSFSTVNSVADEAYNIQYFDGVGRPTLTGSNHPGSTGGYKAQQTIHDQMGRAIKSSNPTEINGSWVPAGDDSAGWLYKQQTYNWQGKPLVTTNPDATTNEVSYSGCGCAGGEVRTLTDEGTVNGGVAKRRQQKIYSDVAGRTVKTETLNWQGGTVLSVTVTAYNALNQETLVREYSGAEGSSSYQDTIMTYDGHARLKTKHVPIQDPGYNTTWTYNSDDTINTITDARGAVSTFGYSGSNRGLVTSILRTISGQPNNTTTFTYDAVGNRTGMSDSTGTTTYAYNQLSQLTSETRTFTGKTGSWAITYGGYNLAGSLLSLTDPFGGQTTYQYDTAGRLSSMGASGYNSGYFYGDTLQSISQFLSSSSYRASGAPKQITYGNGVSESFLYDANLAVTRYDLNNLRSVYPAVSSFTMSWTYDYYNDGMLNHAYDLSNVKFDRKQDFGPDGDLTEAYTNREARGQSYSTSDPDPYRHSIQRDVWGNITSRSGRLWNLVQSDSATYVNNRRQGTTYDSEGNYAVNYNTYDAANQLIYTWSTHVVEGNPEYEMFQSYDGDGASASNRQIIRQGHWIETEHGTELESVTTTDESIYNVRSTVLGGAVIAELKPGTGSALVKNRINIYGNGQRIAREGSAVTYFEHNNPLTGNSMDVGALSADRSIKEIRETDPFGAFIPRVDPISQLDFFQLGAGRPFQESGNPYDVVDGCTLDQMPMPCSYVDRLMRVGGVKSEYPGKLEYRSVYKPGLNPVSGDITYHGIGIFEMEIPKNEDHPARRVFFVQSKDPMSAKPAVLDLKVFEQCLKDLFKVQFSDLTRDEPLKYHSYGRGTFLAQSVKDKKITHFITTDFVSKTRAQLGNGLGGTYDHQPQLNYAASDYVSDPKTSAVAIAATHIHEIGNALAIYTRRRPQAKNLALRKEDPDSGIALEECVFKGWVMQDGRVYNPQ